MKSLPPRPANSSVVLLGLLEPVMVSSNAEPATELTPVKVSVPTDESPVAVPDAPLLVLVQLVRPKVTVTPAAAGRDVDVVVAYDIEAAAAVDEVVAAKSGKGLIASASRKGIGKHRTHDRIDARKRVVTDRRIPVSSPQIDIDRDPCGSVVEA